MTATDVFDLLAPADAGLPERLLKGLNALEDQPPDLAYWQRLHKQYNGFRALKPEQYGGLEVKAQREDAVRAAYLTMRLLAASAISSPNTFKDVAMLEAGLKASGWVPTLAKHMAPLLKEMASALQQSRKEAEVPAASVLLKEFKNAAIKGENWVGICGLVLYSVLLPNLMTAGS